MCECLQYYDERGNPEGRYYCIVCDDMAQEALTGKCCEFNIQAERRAFRDALKSRYFDSDWPDTEFAEWFDKGGMLEITEER